MKDICIIVMCYNSGEILEKVLKSYKDYKLFVYVDSKTNDRTYDIASKYSNSVQIFDFEDFSQARNSCIELTILLLQPDDWIVFTDDSYELIGDLDQLKCLKSECASILIKTDSGIEYRSKRAITADSKYRFCGKVHEELNCSDPYPLEGCYFRDIRTNEHSLRTSNRLKQDLINLNSGQLYYLANTTLQMYVKGLCKIEDTLKYHYTIVKLDNWDSEQKFIVLLNLAFLLKEPKYFIMAAITFSPRAGEAYYKCYKFTEDPRFLKLAFKHKNVDEALCKMPRNVSYKEKIIKEFSMLTLNGD